MTLSGLPIARDRKEREDKDKDDDGSNPSANTTQPTDVKADATCANAKIRYPTDLDLIEEGSKYMDRMIDKV